MTAFMTVLAIVASVLSAPAGATQRTAGLIGGEASYAWIVPSSHVVIGEASYYNDEGNPGGLYGAVNSYRWGDPTYEVEVCRVDDATRCVTVTVRDHMENPVRAIDLSPEAFSRLAKSSAGVVQVTVRPVDTPTVTLPPTDT